MLPSQRFNLNSWAWNQVGQLGFWFLRWHQTHDRFSALLTSGVVSRLWLATAWGAGPTGEAAREARWLLAVGSDQSLRPPEDHLTHGPFGGFHVGREVQTGGTSLLRVAALVSGDWAAHSAREQGMNLAPRFASCRTEASTALAPLGSTPPRLAKGAG